MTLWHVIVLPVQIHPLAILAVGLAALILGGGGGRRPIEVQAGKS